MITAVVEVVVWSFLRRGRCDGGVERAIVGEVRTGKSAAQPCHISCRVSGYRWKKVDELE